MRPRQVARVPVVPTAVPVDAVAAAEATHLATVTRQVADCTRWIPDPRAARQQWIADRERVLEMLRVLVVSCDTLAGLLEEAEEVGPTETRAPESDAYVEAAKVLLEFVSNRHRIMIVASGVLTEEDMERMQRRG
jgi:hypothetical protein